MSNKFKQKARKVIFVVLTSIIFISISIIALMAARGNTLTNEGFSKTGTIRTTIEPSDNITIFLNEQEKTISSNTIANILPGSYAVRISKEGYSSWQQQIEIKAGVITDVTAKLFPLELQLEQLTSTNVDKAFTSRFTSDVFYTVLDTKIGADIGIWKKPMQAAALPLLEQPLLKISNITSLVGEAFNSGDYQIYPSHDGNKILLRAGASYYILSANAYNEPSASNKLNLAYPIERVSWLKDSSDLLIHSEKMLIDYNLDTEASTVIAYGESILNTYSISSKKVLFIQDGRLYSYVTNTATEVVLENIVLPSDILSMRSDYDGENILLTTIDKVYFLNTEESFLDLVGSYSLLSSSPDNTHFLVKDTAGNLSMISVTISKSFNSFEFVPLVVELTEATENLVSIRWSNDGNYFVVSSIDGKTIYSLDADGSNKYRIFEYTEPPMSYSLLNDNSGMLILLADSVLSEEDTASQANIYTLQFE